jgi:hypothetical protein
MLRALWVEGGRASTGVGVNGFGNVEKTFLQPGEAQKKKGRSVAAPQKQNDQVSC